jgi:glucokinase
MSATNATSATKIALAIDIGGTKIRGAAIDADGRMIASNRFAANAAEGALHVLDVIRQSITDLQAQLTVHGIEAVGLGISSAGVIEPQHGEVVNAADQIPGWRGTKFSQVFANVWSGVVVADNDANAALVGEAWMGKHDLPEKCSVAMLTLGTGLGGALMVDGVLQTGRHHLTGHFGLAKMWDAYSQKLVTVEHLVSGTGLVNVYFQREPNSSSHSSRPTGHDIIAQMVAGDVNAAAAVEAWLDHLVLQLHNIYWMLDPDLIIIGGGVVDSRDHWWPAMLQKLSALKVETTIAAATLGNDAGVYGASRLVFNRLASSSALGS